MGPRGASAISPYCMCACIVVPKWDARTADHRAQEDVVLVRLVEEHGTKNWSIIAKGIPGRTGKSCRIRYVS